MFGATSVLNDLEWEPVVSRSYFGWKENEDLMRVAPFSNGTALGCVHVVHIQNEQFSVLKEVYRAFQTSKSRLISSHSSQVL